MLKYSMSTKLLLGLVIASLLVGACGSSSEPPNVGKIESQFSEVMVGESVNFSVEASGTELEFEWSAARGMIESQQAMAQYTAPDSPGEDTVQVHVTSKGETVVKSLTFKVVVPTDTPVPPPTDTLTPINTPKLTDTPSPTLEDMMFPRFCG